MTARTTSFTARRILAASAAAVLTLGVAACSDYGDDDIDNPVDGVDDQVDDVTDSISDDIESETTDG